MKTNWKNVKTAVSIPEPVLEAAKKRAESEDYPSFSAYVAGLILFDIYCGRQHWLTARLANESKEMRDIVIREILENPGKETSWIDKVISDKARELSKDSLEGGA